MGAFLNAPCKREKERREGVSPASRRGGRPLRRAGVRSADRRRRRVAGAGFRGSGGGKREEKGSVLGRAYRSPLFTIFKAFS